MTGQVEGCNHSEKRKPLQRALFDVRNDVVQDALLTAAFHSKFKIGVAAVEAEHNEEKVKP